MDPTLLLEFYVATSFDTTILLTWLIANLGLDRSLNIPFVALNVNKYVLRCLHVGLKIDRDFCCIPFSSLMLEVEFRGLEATCILIIWIFYSLSFVFFFLSRMIAISFNVAFVVFAIECGFFGPGRFCESRLLPAR